MAFDSQDLLDAIDGAGLGVFQLKMILILGGMKMCMGMQMLALGALGDAVATEFSAGRFMKAKSASLLALGMLVGCLASGAIGDAFGRKKTCIFGHVLYTVFGCLATLATGMNAMHMCCLFMGIGFGLMIPASTTIVVESTPTDVRSQCTNSLAIFFPIGEIWASIGLILFTPQLEGAAWRTVLFWTTFPALLLLPIACLFLYESPRWLFLNARVPQLQYLLQQAAEQNGSPNPATLQDDQISISSSAVGEGTPEVNTSTLDRFARLFQPELLETTLILCYLAFLCNFIFYGVGYSLTEQFSKMDDGTISPAGKFMITALFGFPGFIITGVFVNSDSIGHVDTISILCFVCSFLCLSMISADFNLALIPDTCAYLMKFLSVSLFAIFTVYTPEAFPSLLRLTGVGFCNSVGRIGSIVAPLVFESLAELGNGHWPFLLLTALFGLFGVWATQQLTVETKGTPLAEIAQEEILIEQSEAESRFSKMFGEKADSVLSLMNTRRRRRPSLTSLSEATPLSQTCGRVGPSIYR